MPALLVVVRSLGIKLDGKGTKNEPSAEGLALPLGGLSE